jgi:hypothetical protein
MSELISREAAIEEILSWAVCINKPQYLSREDTLTVLNSIPTIDAVPVVHGRWKIGGILNECQVCGEIYSLNGGNVWEPWNYCPNCGAKMDGEADV